MSTIILAGGNSNRFGVPKPFLSFDENSTFLEKIVNVYREFGCKNIVLVLNQNHSELYNSTYPESFRSGINIIYNNKTELGRFYSLKLGADSFQYADFCFIQNIDNPFTDHETLIKLFDNKTEYAYISPVYQNKGGHPILIPKMIIDKIRTESDVNLNTKDFLNRFKKITIEAANDKILANINTPEDYYNAFPVMRK